MKRIRGENDGKPLSNKIVQIGSRMGFLPLVISYFLSQNKVSPAPSLDLPLLADSLKEK